jgi:hypothetical protein
LLTDTNIQFYAFTNLPDLPLQSTGWNVIVMNHHDPRDKDDDGRDDVIINNNNTSNNNATMTTTTMKPYKRFITQSRWPKFQGYKHPVIQRHYHDGGVVFYMDANVVPVGTSRQYQDEARRIRYSRSKLAQKRHPTNPSVEYEFYRIRHWKKDTYDNTRISLKWIRSQPDFRSGEQCQMYENSYFGYAIVKPRSSSEQEEELESKQVEWGTTDFTRTADFFWNRYSLEEDSWRDQPLWCYCLWHTKTRPIDISSDLFYIDLDRMAVGGHSYAQKQPTSTKNVVGRPIVTAAAAIGPTTKPNRQNFNFKKILEKNKEISK